jgi:hypothetical protein
MAYELAAAGAIATSAVTDGKPGEPDSRVLDSPGFDKLVERSLCCDVTADPGPRRRQ